MAAAAPAPNIIATRMALATLLLLYMFTPWITLSDWLFICLFVFYYKKNQGYFA